MYRGLHHRNNSSLPHHHTRNLSPHPSSVPVMPPSHSSSSLSSSFSSSAASSMLLPAGPSNSSKSDILDSDHPISSPAPSCPSNNNLTHPSISPAPPRSSSLARMGQAPSRSPSVPPSLTSTPDDPPPTPGGMFKRWHGRRRKSEDASVVLVSADVLHSRQISKGKERELSDTSAACASPAQQTVHPGAQVLPTTNIPSPKSHKHIFSAQLSSFNVFANRKHPNPPKSPVFSGSAPLPPPKPAELKGKRLPAAPAEKPSPPIDRRLPTPSPSPSSTTHLPPTARQPREDHPSAKEKPDYETKQDWRKSDSTMTSHGTIRPGALGNRSPRPVSLAESSHSGHTVVPVNKRLSALLTDAEFVMPEEGDLADIDQGPTVTSGSGRFSTPSSANKTRNRRSMSLNAPVYFQRSKPSTPEPTHAPPLESGNPIGRTLTETPSLSQNWNRDSATLTKASAKGFIAPTAAPDAAHSTGSNIRSRLAAWTSAANRSERTLSPPPVHPRRGIAPPPSPHPSLRQTAVSMTGGLVPAAGIAMGIGKRAAEKVHKVWGGFGSSSSSNSGYSSSSSIGTGTAPSSYNSSRHSDNVLGRSGSDLSVPSQAPSGPGWKARRRTPNAPSGSWSLASSTTSSVSEYDGVSRPTGPSLGTPLRGPKRMRSRGNIIGGLVFGRDLQACVQETAIESVQASRTPATPTTLERMKPLEERLLPALVVRCAQHLKMWGVQEEGLFRVSGRPAHVAKVRSEFDTGADYNLSECDPGELDPHAVASVFKAYLRELPQSILTSSLVSHFESALASEGGDDASTSSLVAPRFGLGAKNPSLPAGPKGGIPSGLALRKPPSLSTLALPSFAGLRATSEASLEALAVLIALLPAENRDLLYTVVELIQATAERSKETKMPLGNLLLVFCPSLNMSPTLLRVLCESRNIWNGPPPKAPSKPATPKVVPGEPPLPECPVMVQTRGGVSTTSHLDTEPEIGDHLPVNPKVALSSPGRGSSTLLDSPHDDRASYVSALDSTEGIITQPPSPISDSVNLPPLSSSTDSIATPSTLSEASSFRTPSMVGKPYIAKLSESSYSRSPTLADPTDERLPSPVRRAAVSEPIPFPSTGGNALHTPLAHRKSFALLSFPPLRQDPTPASNTSPQMMRRSKRPSLHLLFSKRSATSLPAAPGSAPIPSSAPAMPSQFAHTAPPTALSPTSPVPIRTLAPPVLDTTISSSPIRFAFDPFGGLSDELSKATSSSPFPITDDANSQMPGLRVRADSAASSLYTTPQSTPLSVPSARSRFSSLVLPSPDPALLSATSPSAKVSRSPSQTSLTPSLEVGFERSKEGDWAKSVLLAAHAESAASRSRLSVKEAIKVFEGK